MTAAATSAATSAAASSMAHQKLLDDEFVSRIERLELVSRKIISGKLKGERRSKRRGHSSEFADFRPYVAGDDLRFLDWNIFGRLDRLFLRVFLEEEDLWLSLLLDASASMRFGDPEKFLYAKRIAAALGYIGLAGQDRVRVAKFTDKLQPVFGPARGRRRTHALLETLSSLECDPSAPTDLVRGAKDFVLTGARSGIVVVISDFLDRQGFEVSLRSLLANSRTTEVFLFHVLSPEEIAPSFTGDLRLLDVEDASAAEITISAPLLAQYRRNLDAFRGELARYASRVGFHYVFTSTAVPFDTLILEYLRRRGFVK